MYNDFFWHGLNLVPNGDGDVNLKKSVYYPKNIPLATAARECERVWRSSGAADEKEEE